MIIYVTILGFFALKTQVSPNSQVAVKIGLKDRLDNIVMDERTHMFETKHDLLAYIALKQEMKTMELGKSFGACSLLFIVWNKVAWWRRGLRRQSPNSWNTGSNPTQGCEISATFLCECDNVWMNLYLRQNGYNMIVYEGDVKIL